MSAIKLKKVGTQSTLKMSNHMLKGKTLKNVQKIGKICSNLLNQKKASREKSQNNQENNQDIFWYSHLREAYLGPIQTSMMELFCKKS